MKAGVRVSLRSRGEARLGEEVCEQEDVDWGARLHHTCRRQEARSLHYTYAGVKKHGASCEHRHQLSLASEEAEASV